MPLLGTHPDAASQNASYALCVGFVQPTSGEYIGDRLHVDQPHVEPHALGCRAPRLGDEKVSV